MENQKQVVINIIEDNAKELNVLENSNLTTDFEEGDIVKCTYLKNTLFKVLGKFQDKITITKVNLKDDILQVRPQFLVKQKINKKAIRVLFDED